jgi:hypothetical protein
VNIAFEKGSGKKAKERTISSFSFERREKAIVTYLSRILFTDG